MVMPPEVPCTAFYVKDRRLEQMFPDLDAHTDHRRIGWLCLSLLTVRKTRIDVDPATMLGIIA